MISVGTGLVPIAVGGQYVGSQLMYMRSSWSACIHGLRLDHASTQRFPLPVSDQPVLSLSAFLFVWFTRLILFACLSACLPVCCLCRYEDMYRYTMLLDIDGNAWSSRFPQLLSTNAAVIKQESKYQEWFRPLLHPYEHYVPIGEKEEEKLQRFVCLSCVMLPGTGSLSELLPDLCQQEDP